MLDVCERFQCESRMLEVLPGTTRLTVSVAVLELSHKVSTHRPAASTRHTRRPRGDCAARPCWECGWRAQDQQTLRKVVTAVKQIVSMDPLAEATVKEVANKANYSESRRMRPRRAAADVPQVAHAC